MTVWIIMLVLVLGIVYGVNQIAQNLRLMTEKLKSANFEFWETPTKTIKGNGRKQLKG